MHICDGYGLCEARAGERKDCSDDARKAVAEYTLRMKVSTSAEDGGETCGLD